MRKRMNMLAALLLCGVLFAACGGAAGKSGKETSEKSVSTEETSSVKSEAADSAEAAEAAESTEEAAEAAESTEESTEAAVSTEEGAEAAEDTKGSADSGEASASTGETAEEHESQEADTSMSKAAEQASKDPILEIPTIDGEYKLEDCVKLGNYKGLKLEMKIDEVTDENLDTYISYLVQPEEVEDADAVLDKGDTANLDFTGYLNGEAFSGGSSTGYDLQIGSGSFIPGFEDGMVGMKKGEERDLNLTFPKEYASTELAGKDVVFHVKLNAIKRKPELSDDWAKKYSNGEYLTLEDFRSATRSDLEKQNRSYAEANLQSEAWEMVMKNAEVTALPETLLQARRDEYDGYLKKEAEMYSLSVEDYIKQMGMTMEDYKEINEVQVRHEIKNVLVLDAVAEAEGVTDDDPGYQEELSRLKETYGQTEDELKKNYGEDTLARHLRSVVVMKKILSYAEITETTVSKTAASETADSETASSGS